MKKSLLISATVAMLLVGCGGSNGGSCCSSGFTSKGEDVIVATKGDGKLNNVVVSAKKIKSDGTVVDDSSATSFCTCKEALDSNGQPACKPTNVESEKCKIQLIQKSTCKDTENGTLELATLTEADIAAAKEHIQIDSGAESISYGGSVSLKDVNGNVGTLKADLTFALPADMCGKNIDNPNKSLGFGGYHKESVSGVEQKVYALITDKDGNTEWVEGTIVGGQVVFTDVSLKLPVTVKVFRVTAIQGTGVTGSNG